MKALRVLSLLLAGLPLFAAPSPAFVAFGSAASSASKPYWTSNDGVAWSLQSTAVLPGTNAANVQPFMSATLKRQLLLLATDTNLWSLYRAPIDINGVIGAWTEVEHGTSTFEILECSLAGCAVFGNSSNADNYSSTDGISWHYDGGAYTGLANFPFPYAVGNFVGLINNNPGFFYMNPSASVYSGSSQIFASSGLTGQPVATSYNPATGAVLLDGSGHTTHSTAINNNSAFTTGGMCTVPSPRGETLKGKYYFFGTTGYCSSSDASTFATISATLPAMKSTAYNSSVMILAANGAGIYHFDGTTISSPDASSPTNVLAVASMPPASSAAVIIVTYN